MLKLVKVLSAYYLKNGFTSSKFRYRLQININTLNLENRKHRNLVNDWLFELFYRMSKTVRPIYEQWLRCR